MTVASHERPAAQSALEKARREYAALAEQQRALENERSQIGRMIATDGKLSRERRSELARVNRDLKRLNAPLKRASARLDREQEKASAHAARERERRDARATRERDKRRARVATKVAKVEAASRRKACFARLPQGAKPTRAASTDETRPHLTHGYIVREGKGAKKRFSLLVTDSYQLARLPLDVSHESAIRTGAVLPPEALKAIEKAGAFRVTRNGGIQPLRVTQSSVGPAVTVDNDYGTQQFPQTYQAEKVGTAYMLPEHSPAGPEFVSKMVAMIPKPPSKGNEFRVKLNPALLSQLGQAIAAGKEVTLTFDLSKAGKASQGRRCESPVLVTNGTDAVGLFMPIKVGE